MENLGKLFFFCPKLTADEGTVRISKGLLAQGGFFWQRLQIDYRVSKQFCSKNVVLLTLYLAHAFCIARVLHRTRFASHAFSITCILHRTSYASHAFLHRTLFKTFGFQFGFLYAKLVWSPCRCVTAWPQVSQVQIFSEAKKTRESEILPAAGLTTHKRTHPSQDSWHGRPPELQ